MKESEGMDCEIIVPYEIADPVLVSELNRCHRPRKPRFIEWTARRGPSDVRTAPGSEATEGCKRLDG